MIRKVGVNGMNLEAERNKKIAKRKYDESFEELRKLRRAIVVAESRISVKSLVESYKNAEAGRTYMVRLSIVNGGVYEVPRKFRSGFEKRLAKKLNRIVPVKSVRYNSIFVEGDKNYIEVIFKKTDFEIKNEKAVQDEK
ncbi:MAG: hypothetical protein ACRCZO_19090 [Cetobacterium sp.]